MPGFAHLEDAEIVAIANHTLTAWGNRALAPPEFQSPTVKLVKSTRAERLTAEKVSRHRQQLR